MNADLDIIRALASEYAEAAQDTRNAKNAALYRAVNGLAMDRPVVLIDEEPWSELESDARLGAALLRPDPARRGAVYAPYDLQMASSALGRFLKKAPQTLQKLL